MKLDPKVAGEVCGRVSAITIKLIESIVAIGQREIDAVLANARAIAAETVLDMLDGPEREPDPPAPKKRPKRREKTVARKRAAKVVRGVRSNEAGLTSPAATVPLSVAVKPVERTSTTLPVVASATGAFLVHAPTVERELEADDERDDDADLVQPPYRAGDLATTRSRSQQRNVGSPSASSANVPPPGWTPELDKLEELRDLSFTTAMRKVH